MPRFTAEESDFVKENYLTMAFAEIGQHVGRSSACVSEFCKRSGIRGKRAIIIAEARHPEKHRAYSSWSSMITRCTNNRRNSWERYGGRGIQVCRKWREDFWSFLSDMGEKPRGYSIDRIDPSGDYCPENCRWLPCNQQGQTTEKFLSRGPCVDCGTRVGYNAGRCHRCHQYHWMNGIPRPPVDGDLRKARKVFAACPKCSRHGQLFSKGLCRRCYRAKWAREDRAKKAKP